jgi:DNA-binding CsgD family transcriptional regulator
MLYGRSRERALIAKLLAKAREGHSGVLVVRGEAGIGKHALLEDTAERSGDFCVLRGAGVESEVELPFGAVHQLLRPVLVRLGRLPAPRAAALRGAFGLVDAQANQFLIQLGVLSLLGAVAAEQPVLCLISKARWLDRASRDALLFVARRLRTERIVLLLAARDDDVREFLAPGLPELRLAGLARQAAGQLLQAHAGRLAVQVRDRLIEETGGNPLALLELPQTLTGEQLAGREPLPQRLPLTARLQQVFLQRVRRLPAVTQTLLLVAAAEDAGELATIVAAGRLLGCGLEALEPAEQAGLVRVSGSRLEFRHSLVRSAIYQGATFMAQRAAHQALTEVLEGEQQIDRRAWHLAAATLGPDEDVAEALEGSAGRARRRGGPAAAAAALERAAALTPEPASRARRLVAAAEHLWEGGHGERARALLDQVEPPVADPALLAGIARVRAEIELAAGIPATACTLLVEGAKLILKSEPRRANEMLVLATWAALAANQLDRIVGEISLAGSRVPGPPDVRVGRVAESLIAVGLGRAPPAPAGAVPPMAAAGWPPPWATWEWPMLVVAQPAADAVAANQQYARLVAAGRADGTVSPLIPAMANLAISDFALGRWPDAIGNATEGLRLAKDTGQESMAGYFLVLLATIALRQGRTDDSQRLVDQALAAAVPRRVAVVAAAASWNLARLELAEGRPTAALERLERLLAVAAPQYPTVHAPIALLATPELVEAAARANALEGMEPYVVRLERWAQRDQGTFVLLVAHRCRALICQDDQAERHFQAALTVHGIGELPYELARTELLYGEWLRRARRRADARTHLRIALDLFEQLGATPWVEQVRVELRAIGQTARKRDSSTRVRLTPQERQVAHLAGQGLTNQQIAARLFLSRHTVSYHLRKVFSKLGIVSRVDLHELDPDDDVPGGSQGEPV